MSLSVTGPDGKTVDVPRGVSFPEFEEAAKKALSIEGNSHYFVTPPIGQAKAGLLITAFETIGKKFEDLTAFLDKY